MNFEKYFADELDRVEEGYHDFDAWGDWVDEGDFDDFDAEEALNASGSGSARKSQPIIVSAANTTTTDTANVSLFNAYSKHDGFAVTNINITSGVAGVSYRNILQQSMNKPFEVGITYLYSANAAQILETIKVVKRDINGNDIGQLLVPIVAPNNYQTTSTTIDTPYSIDGYTELLVNQILGSATLKLFMYPSAKVNPTAQISRGSMVRGYRNPKLYRRDKVVIARR